MVMPCLSSVKLTEAYFEWRGVQRLFGIPAVSGSLQTVKHLTLVNLVRTSRYHSVSRDPNGLRFLRSDSLNLMLILYSKIDLAWNQFHDVVSTFPCIETVDMYFASDFNQASLSVTERECVPGMLKSFFDFPRLSRISWHLYQYKRTTGENTWERCLRTVNWGVDRLNFHYPRLYRDPAKEAEETGYILEPEDLKGGVPGYVLEPGNEMDIW